MRALIWREFHCQICDVHLDKNAVQNGNQWYASWVFEPECVTCLCSNLQIQCCDEYSSVVGSEKVTEPRNSS